METQGVNVLGTTREPLLYKCHDGMCGRVEWSALLPPRKGDGVLDTTRTGQSLIIGFMPLNPFMH
jgi:hypothetical protein